MGGARLCTESWSLDTEAGSKDMECLRSGSEVGRAGVRGQKLQLARVAYAARALVPVLLRGFGLSSTLELPTIRYAKQGRAYYWHTQMRKILCDDCCWLLFNWASCKFVASLWLIGIVISEDVSTLPQALMQTTKARLLIFMNKSAFILCPLYKGLFNTAWMSRKS